MRSYSSSTSLAISLPASRMSLVTRSMSVTRNVTVPPGRVASADRPISVSDRSGGNSTARPAATSWINALVAIEVLQLVLTEIAELDAGTLLLIDKACGGAARRALGRRDQPRRCEPRDARRARCSGHRESSGSLVDAYPDAYVGAFGARLRRRAAGSRPQPPQRLSPGRRQGRSPRPGCPSPVRRFCSSAPLTSSRCLESRPE